MNATPVVVAVFLFALPGFPGLVAAVQVPSPAVIPDLIPRPPIWIHGEADFNAANGVVSGSGTSGDPYVISGWDIRPDIAGLYFGGRRPEPVAAGIFIDGTISHVTIRENWIHDAASMSGIIVNAAANVRIEANTIENVGQAVRGQKPTHFAVVDNDIQSSFRGIIVSGSHLDLSRNSITSCATEFGQAMGTAGSNITIAGNVIDGCDYGIHIGFPSDGRSTGSTLDMLIADNRVSNSNIALDTSGCGQGYTFALRRAVIQNNDFAAFNGVQLNCVSNFQLMNNTITSEGFRGLLVNVNSWSSEPGLVRNNHVHGATWDAFTVIGAPMPYLVEWANNSANELPVVVYSRPHDEVLDGQGATVAQLVIADGRNVVAKNWNVVGRQSWTQGQLVQLLGGANVTLENTTVTGGGIRSQYGRGHTFDGNTITDGTLRVEESFGPTLVTGNVVTGWRESFVLQWAAVTAPTHLEGNRFVSTSAAALRASGVNGLTAENNTFVSTATSYPMDLAIDNSTVFHNNNIIGMNGQSAIAHHSWITTADASQNWWGSPGGPNPNNGGSNAVTYSPWLTAPAPGAPESG